MSFQNVANSLPLEAIIIFSATTWMHIIIIQYVYSPLFVCFLPLFFNIRMTTTITMMRIVMAIIKRPPTTPPTMASMLVAAVKIMR